MLDQKTLHRLGVHKHALASNSRKEVEVKSLIKTLIELNISTNDPEFLQFMGDSFNAEAYDIFSSSQTPTSKDCEVLEVRQPHTVATVVDEALKRSKELKVLIDKSGGDITPILNEIRDDTIKAQALKTQLLNELLIRGVDGVSREKMTMLLKLREFVKDDIEFVERMSRKKQEEDEMFESDSESVGDNAGSSDNSRSVL